MTYSTVTNTNKKEPGANLKEYIRELEQKLENTRKATLNLLEDLNEEKAKVETTNKQLENLDRLKDEFLSIASHELRTPLTAIDGITSMIMDGEYGEVNNNLHQPLKDIITSSERLIHLVNDLLSLSRIQAGRLKYALSEFSIAEVITQTVHLLLPLSKQKGLSLTAANLESVVVQGDADKVKEILNNLIGNSLKFTDKGSITVSIKAVNDKVVTFVTDTGIGIAKEEQPKLFGKFQQITSSAGRPAGTGLGLYLSLEMARKMGGNVWLEKSEVGIGSTFAFSIPLANSELARKAEQEIEKEAKAHPDQKSDTIRVNKTKI